MPPPDPASLVERSQIPGEQNLPAAIIELRNALQQNPNSRARAKGSIWSGDAGFATVELRKRALTATPGVLPEPQSR
jgi:hypothetical protein